MNVPKKLFHLNAAILYDTIKYILNIFFCQIKYQRSYRSVASIVSKDPIRILYFMPNNKNKTLLKLSPGKLTKLFLCISLCLKIMKLVSHFYPVVELNRKDSLCIE